MKNLPYLIWLVLIGLSCGSTQELEKGHDPSVDLGTAAGIEHVPQKATHNRPVDIPQLLEVLELTDMEVVEFNAIYKRYANLLVLNNSSDRDARSKVIEKKKLLEARDQYVLNMLDKDQQSIYVEFLRDLAIRKQENSKDGKNDKM